MYKSKKMKKQITIKTGWEVITLKEFEQIDQIVHADIPADYKAVNLLSVLSGEDVSLFENLPIHQFTDLVKHIDFITTELPEVKVKDKYIVNGREYEFHGDIPSITTAQYIDYQTYMKEKPVDLQKVISVFLIPKGHTYNDGYKIEEVLADINDMLIVDVQALGFFIQKQSALFILITKDYLSHQMKKMKIPTQKIREDLTPLSDLALSLLS